MIFSINSIQDLSLEAIQAQIKTERDMNRQIESEERQMITDFYEGLQDKDVYIKAYGFKNDEQNREKTPISFINITKKVIDKISLVYKYAPDRSFEGTQKDAYFEWIEQEPTFNLFMKEAERRKNLLSIVLKRPVYRKEFGWRFYIDTQFEPHFLEGDTLNPVAYSIPVLQDTTNPYDPNTDIWWLYVDKKHWFYYQRDSDRAKEDPSFPGGEHKLDMIPVVESRTSFPVEDYWQSGVIDLVKSNQAININLNNLNRMTHFQAFNYIWTDGMSPEENKDIKIGTDQITVVDSGSMLNSLNLEPKITDTIDAIKFQTSAISMAYNISWEWEMSGDPSSGFALLVKNIDLMEAREDDIEMAKMEEQKVFQLIAKQQDIYKTPGARLPVKGKLIVDFQEVNFPVNAAEDRAEWDWAIKNNGRTMVDWIQADQGLDEKAARERYEQNKALNQQLSASQQALRDVFNEPAPDDTE